MSKSFFQVTEIWLNNTICDEEINIQGYTIFRKDRLAKRGGGTTVYVSEGYSCVHRRDEHDFVVVWIEGKIK